MKPLKIFVIRPISIIGDILLKGIARGFEKAGNQVLLMDVRELEETKINNFNPDFVLGMDYAHLIREDAHKIIQSLNAPVAHFFIDDPNSSFAHAGDLALYDKLSATDGVILCWDEAFLKDFKNKAYYLPTGIDFEVYEKPDPSINIEKSTILFAGRPLTDKREKIISHVAKNFPGLLNIYCYREHFDRSINAMLEKGYLKQEEIEEYKKCYKGFLKDEKELAGAYHKCDIVLNITMEQGPTSMNSRVLEALATDSFLLTDYAEDTSKYFEENKDFVFYKNLDDLTEKIRKYLDNPGLRQEIAGNGRKKVAQNHTLYQRAMQIIEIMQNYL
ncbi:MAG TPA: glycosyltransferase [Candidatus Gastranaerophilales bacterium]|nr:glycosyltransferase [Candidatus Gastranaerophilales bacterium]